MYIILFYQSNNSQIGTSTFQNYNIKHIYTYIYEHVLYVHVGAV